MKFYRDILDVLDDEKACFHMPGHCSGRIYEELGLSGRINDIIKADTTEIPGTDNLHEPEGTIKRLQNNISSIFGSNESVILVNGTTAGLEAAIMSVAGPGDTVILDRGCHQSVYNALVCSGADSVYVSNRTDSSGVIYPPEEKDIIECIRNNKKAAAVVITNPTYYGMTLDISSISKEAHKENMIVIVDEAHGSHFAFSSLMPDSSVICGADIVINSLHKTLPCFTQVSLLHICSKRVDVSRLRYCLKIFETSSPSYIFMGSAELGIEIAQIHGKKRIAENIEYIDELRKKLEKTGYRTVIGDDRLRFFISAEELGLSGREFEEILRKEYSIYTELDSDYGVLFLATFSNRKEDYEYLYDSLEKIASERNKSSIASYGECEESSALCGDDVTGSEITSLKSENISEINFKDKNMIFKVDIPVQKLSARDAFYSKSELVDFEDSEGRICAENVTPYPPGIVMLMPGEEISARIIENIKTLEKNNATVFGIDGGKIRVIKSSIRE